MNAYKISLLTLLIGFTSYVYGIESITVYGTKTYSAWKVSCSGLECKVSANQLANTIKEQMDKYAQEAPKIEEVKQSFCSSMEGKMPSHCSVYKPRAITPSRNPYLFQFKLIIPPITNGCGVGSALEGIAAKLVTIDGFTGDINAPAGPSFLSACNNHDTCYSGDLSQTLCDNSFKEEMYSACSGLERCEEMADGYYGAVRTVGYKAKAEAVKENQCRKFSSDYDRNCQGVIGNSAGT